MKILLSRHWRCAARLWSGILLVSAAAADVADPPGCTLYVALDGSDENAGSRERPFASFKQAFASAADGDTVLLQAGRYTEPIILRDYRKKVRVTPAPGARVVLDGTRRLIGGWKKMEDGTWKKKADFDTWQLFHGEDLVYLARWPDASFEDDSIWRMTRSMRSTDGGYHKQKKEYTGRTREGLLYDADFKDGGPKAFTEGDSRYGTGEQPPSLAASGKDLTGALAVLNFGHWLTWTRPVLRHEPGTDHLEYDATGTHLHKYLAWYALGLPVLDRPNEWWFDAAEQTLYLKPPGGADPNRLELRGKIRDYGVDLEGCSDITFEGLTFFGQGFLVADSERIRFENCVFRYPATHKFVLGQLDWFAHHPTDKDTNRMPMVYGGADHVFLNCEFTRSNAPLLFGGRRTRVDNCLFRDIEWDLNTSGASGSVMVGEDGVFRRNTLHRGGNAEGVRPIRPGATVEWNRVYDVGNLQHDGAAINVGNPAHAGTVLRYNWAHDANRQGIRLDYGSRTTYGDSVYLRNVTWNTQPNQVKGDRNLVLNNTIVNCNRYPNPATERMNFTLMGFKAMHGIDFNRDSVTLNNIANLAHRSWALDREEGVNAYTLPGTADRNMREPGAAYRYLRDAANHDFRPRAGSPLIDGGRTVRPEERPGTVVRFAGLAYEGNAPDIGAYEHGARRFWIPGRQGPAASTPIPRDGAVGVPLDADLMFLEAYRCSRHRVLFGTSPGRLRPLAELNDASTNIVPLPKLGADTTYSWRVEALDGAGNTRSSPTWSFITAGAK